jgi:tetratricopeptide (TPR) repeat protein
LKLCVLFGKSAEELGLVPPDPQPAVPPQREADGKVWFLPQYRNPFFIGREAILQQVHQAFFSTAGMPVMQALSGLAGIGKTQTALEYAYRFRTEYQAVLWLAAETRQILTTKCLHLAPLLHLSVQNEDQSQPVIASVKQWLQQHDQWLLILDNVEDLTLLYEIVPTFYTGHVLLTTREQAPGSLARRRYLERLTDAESALLLCHRSTILALEEPLEDASPGTREMAYEVGRLLDGLPLALDQAGAYIEETGCSIADYLKRYQTSRAFLLQRRGHIPDLHPSSVTTTFTLSFTRLAQQDALAVAMLRLCAFLSPDAIPEEFLSQAGTRAAWPDQKACSLPEEPDAVAVDSALMALRQSSLLQRHPETRMVSLHRLVQTVLKEQMDEQERRMWAERAVQIVSAAFPDVERLTTWSLCQRYLPQASACMALIEQWQMNSPEALRLIAHTSAYLRERVQQAQADTLATRAATLDLQALEPFSHDPITNFFSLLRHAYYQGKYREISSVIHEQVTLLEQRLGPGHPDTIYLLIGQAFLLQMEGNYFRAEELYQQALTTENVSLLYQRLALSDKERGEVGLPHIGFVLSLLGQLYTAQGNYPQAEACFQQSRAVWDQYTHLAPHLFKGPYLHGYALLSLIQQRYEMARDLLQQEQVLLEEILGENHPLRADNINAFAHLALVQGEHASAERLLRQAQVIFERTTGLEHPFVAETFHLWAQVHLRQGNLDQAEELGRRAVQVSEHTQGPAHPKMASCLKTLADIFCCQSRWSEAEALYQRALTLDGEMLGTSHPLEV